MLWQTPSLQLPPPASWALGAPRPSHCTTTAASPASQSGQMGQVHLTGRAGPHVHILATGGWEGNTWYLQSLYLKVGSPHTKIHQVRSSSIIERGLRYLVGWKMINAYPSSYEHTHIYAQLFLTSFTGPCSKGWQFLLCMFSSAHILLRFHLCHSFMASKCTSLASFTSSLWWSLLKVCQNPLPFSSGEREF